MTRHTPRIVLLAFWLGTRDGFRQCWDLSSGLTWDNPSTAPSRAYDRGANLGQRLGRRHQQIVARLRLLDPTRPLGE